ncbi:MAG: isoprenylcysteine carboxylmethyltransferase family protein [Ardenticatenaceae bacterium]|nr:isoprenylcysteine carboxylmethyltransferase family protein [Ardenticatenaceae bacterium]
MTVFKSLLYLIFEAGLFVLYIPLAFLRTGSRIETSVLSFLAIPLWLIGSLMVLWCFWAFTFTGRGTPLPTDPPKELVTTGPYRYVRNPIYVGAAFIFLGHFLWFGYWALLIYPSLAFIGAHFFVVLYEEPTLKRKFGASYEEYLESVPRWVPKFR